MSRVKVMLWTKGAVEFSLLLISEKYGELMGWSVCSGKCLIFIGG